MKEKMFLNKQVNEGGEEIAKEDKNIFKKFQEKISNAYEKFKGLSSQFIKATLMASMITPPSAFSETQGKEVNKEKPEIEFSIQGELSGEVESIDDKDKKKTSLSVERNQLGNLEKTEQDKIDEVIDKKHEEKVKNNKREFAKTQEEVASVLRHAFVEYRGVFKTAESFRAAISHQYNNILNEKQILDLYSIIETGYSTNENKGKDVETIQIIYNDLARSGNPDSKGFTETLESNSSKPKGIDNMLGRATREVTNNLKILLTPVFNKIQSKEVSPIKQDDGRPMPQKMEVPTDTRERLGDITFGLEKKINFTNEQVEQIEKFIPTLEKLDVSSLERLNDYLKQFKSSDFDKIKIVGLGHEAGKEYDFHEIEHLKPGIYTIEGGNFYVTFDYVENAKDGTKVIEKFNMDNGNGLGVSFDKIVRNGTNEGDYSLGVDNVIIKLDGIEIEIEKISKYETEDEIAGQVNNVTFKIGGWTTKISNLGMKFDKSGGFDLSKVATDIWKGRDGARVGDLLERFDIDGGILDLKNEDGSVVINYDGQNLIFNNAKVFKDENGNFNLQNIKSGDGIVYNGGFTSYAEVNGQGMTIGALVDKVIYGGGEVMLNSPDVKLGFSALGGAFSMESGVGSNFDEAKLDQCGKKVDSTFQVIGDKIKNFSEVAKNSNGGDLIGKGIALKTDIINDLVELADYIGKEGDVKLEDYKIILDFIKLSENLVVTGEEGPGNDFYKLEILFKALGNDFGRVVIDKEFIDGVKAGGLDYAVKKLGWGEDVKDVGNKFSEKAIDMIGADFLNEKASDIFEVINTVNNGGVGGLSIDSEGRFKAYYSLVQNLEKLTNHKIHVIGTVYAAPGDFNNHGQVGFVPLVDKPGKEQVGIGYNLDQKFGGGILFTKILVKNEEKGNTLTAIVGGGADFTTGAFDISISDGQGNIFKGLSLENAMKMLDGKGTADFAQEQLELANKLEKGVVIPHVSLGANFRKDFGAQGIKLEASALVSWIPTTNDIHPNLEILAEKALSTKITPMSIGIKLALNGKPGATVLEKMNESTARVYLRASLNGYNPRYKKHH
ncbi:MAG: hypothetical protein WC908_02910 [Candidatus Paceibacterota bacterium]